MSELYPTNRIDPSADYYEITLLGDGGGNIWTVGFTGWIGFADEERKIEIRELSLIRPDIAAKNWEEFGQPFSVVNTDRDYCGWVLAGGHALITHPMVQAHMSLQLRPRECVREGALGFTAKGRLPENAFQRAPTPKLRMRILKRYGYRCLLCGRRPADYVDVELHVHHIRPFGEGGVTVEKNLVSLCHTCHGGLDPHFEWDLFKLVDPLFTEGESIKKRMLEEYIEGVRYYREAMQALVRAANY